MKKQESKYFNINAPHKVAASIIDGKKDLERKIKVTKGLNKVESIRLLKDWQSIVADLSTKKLSDSAKIKHFMNLLQFLDDNFVSHKSEKPIQQYSAPIQKYLVNLIDKVVNTIKDENAHNELFKDIYKTDHLKETEKK